MRQFSDNEKEILESYDLDIERDTSIDPDRLDIEWLELQNTTMDYCYMAREAALTRDNLRLNVDVTKDELDKVKADVALDVRDNPQDYDVDHLPRVTDDVVKSVVNADERVTQAREAHYEAWREYNEAKYFQGLIQDAVNCMQMKKDTLEALVRLHGMGWFSMPKEPREFNTNSYLKRAKRDRAKSMIRKQMKSRRRGE